MQFREATISDIAQLQIIRQAVKENRLSDPSLVKKEDYVEFLERRGKGWVCESDGNILGFAIADLQEENIWALFVSPEYEAKGIGKRLQQLMLDWYFNQNKKYVWLGTEPNSRAERFYRRSGWKHAGVRKNGEIKFEMTDNRWVNNKNTENYSAWSLHYDAMQNRTRDLEAQAIRTVLKDIKFETVLELGCGTGKNTEWLATKATHITAVDLNTDMQQIAREKLKEKNIDFFIADITEDWSFMYEPADLISSSLVLEHTENLDLIFAKAAKHLKNTGYFYVGELHPFRQYQGGQAHFETPEGRVTLECFTHHISDYMQAAFQHHFTCISLTEWFDEDDKKSTQRILAFLFQKN
jgi:ubiquinone/menaquinone biosynthesis C-methylase UbiE/GNAT superfamily N-acetyltransferase